MISRPTCAVEGCTKYVQTEGHKKDGTPKYAKLCSRHHKQKYKQYLGNSKDRRAGKSQFDNKQCSICAWQGPCARHRIIYGKHGGKYESGNVLILCPNCHRLLHMGRLTINLRPA